MPLILGADIRCSALPCPAPLYPFSCTRRRPFAPITAVVGSSRRRRRRIASLHPPILPSRSLLRRPSIHRPVPRSARASANACNCCCDAPTLSAPVCVCVFVCMCVWPVVAVGISYCIAAVELIAAADPLARPGSTAYLRKGTDKGAYETHAPSSTQQPKQGSGRRYSWQRHAMM
jgi:hypothetical protein